MEPDLQEQPAPAPSPRRARSPWLLVTLGAVGALAVAGVIWGIIAASSPTTFTLGGAVSLHSPDVERSDSGSCSGAGRYSDIHDKTSVTIYDANGKVLAVGELSQSMGARGVGCTYQFDVPGVPDGERFYQVEVSSRGKVTFTAEKAKAGKVLVTLGS